MSDRKALELSFNGISPFKRGEGSIVIYRPDDRPFLSFIEIDQLRQQAQQETQQAQQETQQVQQQAEKLAAKLRELGIDPNNL